MRLGAVTSLRGGGTERSGAKERGDEEDTTSGEHAGEKACSRESEVSASCPGRVFVCGRQTHTLSSALLRGSNLTVLTSWILDQSMTQMDKSAILLLDITDTMLL